MKVPLIAKMPWDMVVFLTITTVGFGLSIKRFAHPDSLRTTASVEITQTASESASSRTGIGAIELGCLDRSGGIRSSEVSQGAIRIKGKFCDLPKDESKEALASVRIKNVSTEHESMIFIAGNDAFVTDGMALKSGKNVLTLEWKSKSGLKQMRAEIIGK